MRNCVCLLTLIIAGGRGGESKGSAKSRMRGKHHSCALAATSELSPSPERGSSSMGRELIVVVCEEANVWEALGGGEQMRASS